MTSWKGHVSSNDIMMVIIHGPLDRYVNLRVVHAPGMTGSFLQTPRVSDPDMHHGTCVTRVPWCMPGSLTSGFLWSRCRGKHSRHPGACATYNITYLVRGPYTDWIKEIHKYHVWNTSIYVVWCNRTLCFFTSWREMIVYLICGISYNLKYVIKCSVILLWP